MTKSRKVEYWKITTPLKAKPRYTERFTVTIAMFPNYELFEANITKYTAANCRK